MWDVKATRPWEWPGRRSRVPAPLFPSHQPAVHRLEGSHLAPDQTRALGHLLFLLLGGGGRILQAGGQWAAHPGWEWPMTGGCVWPCWLPDRTPRGQQRPRGRGQLRLGLGEARVHPGPRGPQRAPRAPPAASAWLHWPSRTWSHASGPLSQSGCQGQCPGRVFPRTWVLTVKFS